MPECQKLKNGGLDQYGAEPFEQQQCGTAGVEWVKFAHVNLGLFVHVLFNLISTYANCVVDIRQCTILDASQSCTNRNRCTQRLVILHAQTY